MALSLSSVKTSHALVCFDSTRKAGERAVFSLPAVLNNLNVPSLRDLRGILEGRTIEVGASAQVVANTPINEAHIVARRALFNERQSTMRKDEPTPVTTLTLQNGYPFPAVESDSDNAAERACEMTLAIKGVTAFEMKHTVTIEFATRDAYDAAQRLTGWREWSDLVLEALTSGPDGYGHPAICASGIAYCGFMVTTA